MGVRLRDLRRNERTLTIPIDDAALTVTYRPGGITPGTYDQLSGGQMTATMAADLLAEMLGGWDLEEDDGTPMTTDRERLRRLDTEILFLVLGAIVEDSRPNARSAETSGAGSLSKVN